MAIAYPIAPGVRFKSIEGKPGYCVGDDGSVWSCVLKGTKRGIGGEWRRLRGHAQRSGHIIVNLGRGNANARYVHRLVLEAFVGPCPEGMECRHLDGNPANNRPGNLAWGTPRENQADSARHGTAYCHTAENAMRLRDDRLKLWNFVEHKSGEKHHRSKLSDEQVRIIKATVDPAKRDGTATRLAQEWNVSPATIRLIARGMRRRSG